ncbi:MAG: glucoamylase family protein [Myxococcota bacterium]
MSARAAKIEDAPEEVLLDTLQRNSYAYFQEMRLANGLVPDKSSPDSPVSIAAVGLGITATLVAVSRGFVSRRDGATHALQAIRFFERCACGPEADATGYRGFFYHFLDRDTGRRTWGSELSSIDTALLVAGFLSAAAFYDRDDELEATVRTRAVALYDRIDWRWMHDGGPLTRHGWKPEGGFLPYRWGGYSEALLLYVLALGSDTHPVPPEAYDAFTDGYHWKTIYGHEYVYAGPLFIHQLPQCWLDLRGLADRALAGRGVDYFELSRRATLVQQEYAVRNPREFAHYGRHHWGITASDGPGPVVREVDGRRLKFFGYTARGAPYGPDDGTIAPWGAVSSLPFAPEVVLPTIRRFHHDDIGADGRPFGFEATVNFTFPTEDGCWRSPCNFGLHQGPVVSMPEHHRPGLVWELRRRSAPVVRGLRRAGFTGGWLEG